MERNFSDLATLPGTGHPAGRAEGQRPRTHPQASTPALPGPYPYWKEAASRRAVPRQQAGEGWAQGSPEPTDTSALKGQLLSSLGGGSHNAWWGNKGPFWDKDLVLVYSGY